MISKKTEKGFHVNGTSQFNHFERSKMKAGQGRKKRGWKEKSNGEIERRKKRAMKT